MTTKIWSTLIGIPALLALAACTAAPVDGQEAPASSEVKVNAAEAAKPKLGAQMKSQCMINDDNSEAICCNTTDCWYVNLTQPTYDPYEHR